MHIIPVIDILGGAVVRAIAGRRQEYRPIATPLARSSSPRDVVSGLLQLSSFDRFYVADLDAIEGRADNRATIRDLIEANPRITFIIDSGRSFPDWRGVERAAAVIGSESFSDTDLEIFRDAKLDPDVVLSLDYLGERFLGPQALVSSPGLWPRRVIVMTLSRVGAGAGPDLKMFSHIRACAGDRELYAAGGVRGRDDLLALQAAGAAGALVASALHDGRLTQDDLAKLRGEE